MLYLDERVWIRTAVVRYFAGSIIERCRIGYWFCPPLRQADAISILL